MKIEQMSMLEVAEKLMQDKKKPQKFVDLAREVAEMKGLNFEESAEKIGQFYTDLTMSSKFVYCGEETFNLKNREGTSLLEREFFEEGQAEVDELQKRLDAMPKKAVEHTPVQPKFTRIESFVPVGLDDEEDDTEEEDDDVEYIDDVISGKSYDEEEDYEDDFEEEDQYAEYDEEE